MAIPDREWPVYLRPTEGQKKNVHVPQSGRLCSLVWDVHGDYVRGQRIHQLVAGLVFFDSWGGERMEGTVGLFLVAYSDSDSLFHFFCCCCELRSFCQSFAEPLYSLPYRWLSSLSEGRTGGRLIGTGYCYSEGHSVRRARARETLLWTISRFDWLEVVSLSFRTPTLVLLPVGVLPSILYNFSAESRKSALWTDILALSFSHNALSILKLDSFQTGCILLSGLFFYDIYWVFGTEVVRRRSNKRQGLV